MKQREKRGVQLPGAITGTLLVLHTVVVVNPSFLEGISFNHIIANLQSRQISKDAGSLSL